jgi:hypothetical protein
MLVSPVEYNSRGYNNTSMYSGYVRKRVYCKPVYVSGTQIQCDTNTGLEALKGEAIADVIVSFTVFVIKFTRRVVLPGDPVQF